MTTNRSEGNPATTQSGRRRFLETSAAAGLLILRPQTVFGTQANSAVEIGLLGCGSRGRWIGGFFQEHTGARVVALGDVFADMAQATQQKLNATSARMYIGLDAYRALADSKLDAVVVETPEYFHPEHVAAAVDARKHVYMSKPLAVDVPGCLSIRRSGQRAQANQRCLLVDFQTRVRPVFQEAVARVRRGDIGVPVLGHVYYHAQRLKVIQVPGASAAEHRLRNWVFDKALSGDIIVDQDIQALDMINWYLDGHPTQAFGTGGRKARVDIGDCWDHFLVQYWYPNDVKVDFSGAQFCKGAAYAAGIICARLYGTLGTLDTYYRGAVRIEGDKPWNGTDKDATFDQGAITNVTAFIAAIREGRLLNNVEASVESTLTCILGRTAAYRQRLVTWDEMLRENEKLEANLKL